jgi:hypothetical protein
VSLSGARAARLMGAVAAGGLAVANWEPSWRTTRPGVLGIDGALVLLGLGFIARQPGRWTAPACLGLLMGRGLVLTLMAWHVALAAVVPRAFSLLILGWMAGSLAMGRVWLLAGGALATAVAMGSGAPRVALVLNTFWLGALGAWMAPWTISRLLPWPARTRPAGRGGVGQLMGGFGDRDQTMVPTQVQESAGGERSSEIGDRGVAQDGRPGKSG